MARRPGRLGRVAYSPMAPAPLAYVELKNIVDMTLNLEQAEMETTTHDDGAWQSFIPSRKGGTMDVSLRYDDADTTQDAMRTSYFDGTMLMWRYRQDVADGLEEYTFPGFITSIKPNAPNNDPSAYDISVRIAGTVVVADQVIP